MSKRKADGLYRAVTMEKRARTAPISTVKNKRSISASSFDRSVKKSMIKAAEPKYYTDTWAAQSFTANKVGQVSANNSGHDVHTLALPIEGLDSDNRVGRRVTITGIDIEYSFWQMNGGSSDEVRVSLIEIQNSAGVSIGNYLNPNPAINYASQYLGASDYFVYDNSCTRNPDYMANYKTLSIKDFKLPAMQVSTATNFTRKTGRYFVSINDLAVDFATATATSGTNKNLAILLTCDGGNTASATACTLGAVADTAVSTGLNFAYSYRIHYKDL